MHFCRQVLCRAVQFDPRASRWCVWVGVAMAAGAGCILDPCLLGEAFCCLRQWADAWSAQRPELPA